MELKPCICCGSEAVLNFIVRKNVPIYVVRCKNVLCMLHRSLPEWNFSESKETAIKEWNRVNPDE